MSRSDSEQKVSSAKARDIAREILIKVRQKPQNRVDRDYLYEEELSDLDREVYDDIVDFLLDHTAPLEAAPATDGQELYLRAPDDILNYCSGLENKQTCPLDFFNDDE